jgi:hypothetical protein
VLSESQKVSRAMVHVISCWPLTAETQVCARVCHVGFLVDKVLLLLVFSLSTSVSLFISFHHGSLYSYVIWGKNNRPASDRGSETESHPIDMSNNPKSLM